MTRPSQVREVREERMENEFDPEGLGHRIQKYRQEVVALRDRYGREFFETQDREAFAKAQVLQDVLNLLRDALKAGEE